MRGLSAREVVGRETLDKLSEVTDGESAVSAWLTVRILNSDQLLVSINETIICCVSARLPLPLLLDQPVFF